MFPCVRANHLFSKIESLFVVLVLNKASFVLKLCLKGSFRRQLGLLDFVVYFGLYGESIYDIVFFFFFSNEHLFN